MKVGDLVRCPAYQLGDCRQKSYFGLILGVYGHKADIMGGPKKREMWDICDLTLSVKLDV